MSGAHIGSAAQAGHGLQIRYLHRPRLARHLVRRRRDAAADRCAWWQTEATHLPAERVLAFRAELLREHSEVEASLPKGQGSSS
jgi:hypothetical protein